MQNLTQYCFSIRVPQTEKSKFIGTINMFLCDLERV